VSYHLRTPDAGEPLDSYRCPDLSPRGLALTPRTFGEGVHALLATSPAKGNNGIVAGSRSALVIDAGVTPRVSRLIQDLAASLTSSPVRYLANTTHRGDHTFGNAAFPASVTVLASVPAEAAMGSLAEEKALRLPDMQGDDEALNEVTGWRLPDVTFESSLEIELGGVTVQLWHFGPGSSPGDTIIYVPHAQTAWTGDFLNHAGLPPIRPDGCPLAYAASLRRMRDLLPGLRTVIPAHGPPGDAQPAISWMITYLCDLHSNVKALWECGASAREAVAVCMFSRSWSAPSLSAAAAGYEFSQPGAGRSYLTGLAASLHRANIVAAYRSLGQAGRRQRAASAASGNRCPQTGHDGTSESARHEQLIPGGP
jgi:cyclase